MSKNLTYIVALCEKLQSQQKQPSVALIKKISNRPLPLPEVISVLKRWKEAPEQLPIPTEDDINEPTAVSTTEQKVAELTKRVADLEQQLRELTAAFHKITSSS